MALTKCINSESKQYKPVLVDKLILDDVPTVNSLNAITSDAVARAVAGASGEVPAVTENDNGKVLKAVYDAGGPAVEWGEAAPAVTVDQTYNALSENPQSGVAVAEAIAAIPSSSYTAGDGIKIDNGEVSVDYDANTIDAVASQVTENVSTVVNGHHINFNIEDSQFEVPLEIQSWYNIYPAPTSTITMTIPANTFYYSGTISAGQTVVVTVFNTSFQLTTVCNLTSQPLTTTYDSAENKTWIDGQTLTFHYPLNTPEWNEQYSGKLKTMALGVFDYSTFTTIPFHTDSTTLANPIVFTYTSASHKKIAVKNPLPASTSADENKVLTVDAQGEPQWQTAQGGGSSYTAGTGININNDAISVKFEANSGLMADWKYDTVATQADYISGYTQQMAIYQTTIKQLTITSSYCGGRLCVIIRPARFSGSLGFRDTGLDQSTGWTVIAYDSSDPENKYAYATESYPYESTSSSGYYKATVMEARSNKPDKYFVFTFSTGNVHGDLSANSTCFAIVPKPGESFTGTSPWGVPVADYISPEGIITNADGWSCPVSGSDTVDYTYLKIRYAIPSYNKTTDVGKVLQVQADGTLKWVTLS